MKKVFILIALCAIAAGANAQLKVIANGKVGVGTNAPLEQMQIGDIWTFHNGGTQFIGRNVTWTPSGDVRIANGASNMIRFEEGGITLAATGTGSVGSTVNITGKTLTLDAAGNVGIGITPEYKLHVLGNTCLRGPLRLDGWTDILFDWTGESGGVAIYPETNGHLQLGKSGNGIWKIFAHSVNSLIFPATSDEKVKENIRRLDNPIEKIKQISAYRYYFKREILPDSLSSKTLSNLMKEQIGFIAQELEQEFPELVYAPDSIDQYYSINYNGMIPVLLEAIKEQQIQIENLQEQIDACCQQNPAYSPPKNPSENNEQEEIQNESPLKSTSVGGSNILDVATARLFQNTPNPFSANTEIRFEIPQNTTSAKLLIHDMQGGEIKSYAISQRGSGSIIINGFELPAGMYMYTLLVNNTIVDTKKMILTK